MNLEIVKCHGSGNDFPLIDSRGLNVSDAEWARIAIALADRDGTVGGDGILLLNTRENSYPFDMRMFNSDGSEAETCLNGLRCVARAGFEALGIDAARVGLKQSAAVVSRDPELAPGVYTVREVAGPADLDVAQWPLHAGLARIVDAIVPLLGSARRFTAVAMPNPHLVTFVERIDEAELVALGNACEAAPAWLPNRANVSFVEVRGPDTLFVRTFERGVGLTDSCGSAMAASTFAACLTGRCAQDTEITVLNRGGMVRAEASAAGMVRLSGNATFEWAGTVEVDLVAARAGPVTITRRFDAEVAAWTALQAGLRAPTGADRSFG